MSPLQLIPNHPGVSRKIRLYIKRDDLLHPEIQGSKGRKLEAVLQGLLSTHPGGVLTFGGAFSNHLHAVAVAGRLWGIPTTGILRGEHVDLQNPTLRYCHENGMKLLPRPKAWYDSFKNREWPEFQLEFPGTYLLPEGGDTPEAVLACAAIAKEIEAQLPATCFEGRVYCCTPAGTGCTAAGLISGLKHPRSIAMVFPVTHHGFGRTTLLERLPGASGAGRRFEIVADYTFGGFAKLHLPVVAFARQFHTETGILLDPVYTAKMCYGIFDMLEKGLFEAGSTVVALHTGGMQGWEGFAARYGVHE